MITKLLVWMGWLSKCCSAPIEEAPPGYNKEYCSKCGKLTAKWSRDF